MMDTPMKIKRIAIVGGGTAGWLAANHLGFELRLDPEVEITLIESEDVPIIGVGEGTVPLIKKSLQKFGISEAELLVSCDATFKNGIKFVNWLNPQVHGDDNFYYHPFGSPYPSGFDVTPYWLANRKASRFSDVTETVAVAEALRSPKKISSPPYQGEVEYAYHLNAHKFAMLLANNAKERFGVQHKLATIVSAARAPDGGIDHLLLKSGEVIDFDFYVDCSGFASLLAGQTLNIPFVDKSPQILTDTALVQQVVTDAAEEIPPYTQATAHEAGWIWDIPVTNRRGTGFVYSSAHMSEERAMESFANYLGVSPSAFAPRKIPMKIGYRKTFWSHNCISLGLAQGFVEPLEATSILLTDFSAEIFARNFPRFRDDIPVLQRHCNEVVEYTWERIIDFVQLHYFLSDRSDSQFWLDNRNSQHVSETLRDRLARWQLAHPKKSDFFSRFDLFDVDNFLYVLYGMDYPTRPTLYSSFEADESRAQFERIAKSSQDLIDVLPGHREWLSKLKIAMGRA
jgi:tryptophan halogenase